MGNITGFKVHPRKDFEKEKPTDRIQHWKEFYKDMDEDEIRAQGSRCMDCGVPFCQSGCPIGNIITDWNDLVYHNKWK